MRKEELKTISNAQKATLLCESANEGYRIGTTKNQMKLGALAINEITISVNEVPDGTADSIISNISAELQKLRSIAHTLKIPNADQINVTSSTSDSAANQTHLVRVTSQAYSKGIDMATSL